MNLEEIWARTVDRYPYLSKIPPFKTKWLYALYNEFFERADKIDVLLELGIYQAGSMILWREALGCEVVGVDLSPAPATTSLLERYLRDSDGSGSITCFWKTDQADELSLRKIVAEHGSALDVVIDDASHLYRPTRRSFEILFPYVRPGHSYFIEDWAAGMRSDFQSDDGPVSRVLLDAITWLQEGAYGIAEVNVRPGAARVTKAHSI